MMNFKKLVSTCLVIMTSTTVLIAQDIRNNPTSNHGNKFEQLGTILATPNEYRTASGAPGPKYWQQRADYDIKATLDEKKLLLTGAETVTYFNNSPDVLTYLWLQLDENQHSSVNNGGFPEESRMGRAVTPASIDKMIAQKSDNGLGHIISSLTDAIGAKLKYTINGTMMRIEVPAPLKPGQKFTFKLNWSYKITDRMTFAGRGGYEYFPADGNYLFTMTQWYPRLCVYSDFQGWQNHQFTDRGEFALVFGNYKVAITVPSDHVVMATGQGQNYPAVLSAAQLAEMLQRDPARRPSIKKILEKDFLNERIASLLSHTVAKHELAKSLQKSQEGLPPVVTDRPPTSPAPEDSKSPLMRAATPDSARPRSRAQTPSEESKGADEDYNEVIIQSLQDCLNRKPGSDDSYFEEKPEDRVYERFLTPDGPLPGIGGRDSIYARIEALRMYLEQQLGIEEFREAYTCMMDSDDVDSEVLQRILGPKKLKYVSVIAQMIVCEEECYSNS